MPLTPLQKDVLAILARQRSQESHFAGGVVLNAAEDSPRYSRDFDIFHDVAAEVSKASERDASSLRAAGFHFEAASNRGEWERESAFRSGRVIRGAESVEIDWAADSAFRFFPIVQDSELGWRLHHFDAATNKALALSSRTETRDYLDILEFHKRYPLAALCWAACGKDPGFTPVSLLEMMRRFAKVDPAELEKMIARPLDPVALKLEWTEISAEAETKIIQIADARPDLPIGVAFVNEAGQPGWIGDDPSLRVHHPSLRGCWPAVRARDR